jgi:signal transduction histidine kinase
VRPLSIRASLTAWFVGLTTLLLAAFSITLYVSSSRNLRDGLDARLTTEAMGLLALCDWDEEIGGPQVEMSEELTERLAELRPESGSQVWIWPDQVGIYRSGEQISAPFPPEEWTADFTSDQGTKAHYSTVAGEDGLLRLCALLAFMPGVPADGDEPAKEPFTVLVRTAENYGPVQAQLAHLAWFIAGLAIVSGGVIVLFALLLSRRVIRPLKELGDAAGQIRAGQATRLPRRGAGDEVDELADHLEDAFQRLDESMQRQARFTSDAAHELRNPISVIQSAADVALRRERTPEEYRAFLADVLATSRRMGAVMEALLLLARLDAGKTGATLKPVDLVAIAHDSAKALPGAKGRVRVTGAEPVPVAGDDALLRVLVDNLLSNALRYSPADQEVAVRVEMNGHPTLMVQDHGPGIPADHVEHVFGRFYRVANANPGVQGAGLGLAIVAEIARLHGAQPRIDTSPAGTTVSVDFPPPPS